MAVFSELSSSLTLDSSDFKRGLKSASGFATSFSETTSSAFENVDDEASAASRAINSVSRAMGGVARSATTAIVPVNRAAGAIDNAGDEASGTSRSFGILTLSASGLSASFGILTASATSLAGALALITIALTPLIGVLATATAAFGAIAAIFGVILGSGIAAYMKETGTTIKSLVKTVKQAVISFGKQFIPLIKDAVALLPSFIKRISQAVGSLDPFVKALRVLGTIAYNVIPPLIGLFFDLAKAALPFFIKAAKWIGKNLVPALRALFKAGQRAAGEVYRLAKGLFNVAKSLAGLAGWVGRFVVALYDLAAAALGVGKLTKELKRVGEIIRGGLKGAFNWLSTTGVQLARQAFGFVADAAMSAFKFTKKEIVPAVKSGLSFAWTWIKTKGKKKAKKAFGFLADKAVAAFKFAKSDLLPDLKKALGKVWTWIKTKGKKKAKKAIGFLADKAELAFDWTRTTFVPEAKDAVVGVATWIRTKGKRKLKAAMGVMTGVAVGVVKRSAKAIGISWQRQISPLIKTTKKIFGVVKRAIAGAMGFVLSLIRTTLREWSRLWSLHMGHAMEDLRQVKKFIGRVLNGMKIVIGVFVKAVLGVWRAFGGKLRSITRFVWDAISSIIGAVLDIIGTAIDVFTDILVGDWKGAFNAISKLSSRILGGILDFVVKWGGRLVDAIKDFFGGIVHYLKHDFWSDFTGTIDKAADAAWKRIHKFGVDAWNTITNFFGDIINYFQTQFLSDIVSALSNAAKQAVKTFKRVFNSHIPDKITIPSVSVGGHTIGGGAIDLPSLDVGGTIQSDGIFYGHAGETIVPADADMPYSGGGGAGGTQDVNVVVDVRGDSELAKMIERHIEANEQQRDTAVDRARVSFGSDA